MRRGYTVESYLQLVSAMREKIPSITFTSDFICGFVGETEQAHQRSLELIEKVKYSFLYFYPYSVREVRIPLHFAFRNIPKVQMFDVRSLIRFCPKC